MVWVPLLNKSRDLRYHLIFVAKMIQKFVQSLKYEQFIQLYSLRTLQKHFILLYNFDIL